MKTCSFYSLLTKGGKVDRGRIQGLMGLGQPQF
jgi:hypothetical protein